MIRTGDEMKQPLERVVVIGTSGSGKTHLAQRLAAVLGVDHTELFMRGVEARFESRA